MQPIIQNKTFIQIAPRTRLNSTEQTTTLMKLQIFQNRHHMLIVQIALISNNFGKIKPHMVKLISTESSIVILDLKFYRHDYMTKIEFHKFSQIFLSKETI